MYRGTWLLVGIPLLLWFVQRSLASPEQFSAAMQPLTSPFGKLMLLVLDVPGGENRTAPGDGLERLPGAHPVAAETRFEHGVDARKQRRSAHQEHVVDLRLGEAGRGGLG